MRCPDRISRFCTIRVKATGYSTHYVAWDGYRDSGRYAVQWRINGLLVRKELAARSRFEAAAVSSDWKWIAVSSSAVRPDHARLGGLPWREPVRVSGDRREGAGDHTSVQADRLNNTGASPGA
jgi:hypothetical protein